MHQQMPVSIPSKQSHIDKNKLTYRSYPSHSSKTSIVNFQSKSNTPRYGFNAEKFFTMVAAKTAGAGTEQDRHAHFCTAVYQHVWTRFVQHHQDEYCPALQMYASGTPDGVYGCR